MVLWGETDRYLFNEGRHHELWRHLGAHPEASGTGVEFSVWAPNAVAVSVVGDFNSFMAGADPLYPQESTGVWSGVAPAARPGQCYKFAITDRAGNTFEKADPMAQQTEVPPRTASVVPAPTSHAWGDGEWLSRRAGSNPWKEQMSIYEVHLGSWRAIDNYRELAHQLVDHVKDLGFTHIELLPVAEHPFGGSWGYQVTSHFAPTSRFGSPDDFRYFVDHCHANGIGVLVDWVPAHFPKDDWALAQFDGTALYEHADPRQGEHPDWGTLVFNFGRHEVRNFLIASALFWIEEFHVDGLRVDAVASMLYLDYSRKEGEWVANEHGGRENLEAVAFLRELNTVVHEKHAGVLMIAEESTAWPGVSRPVDSGGLGFGFKWNMGWMHDTLRYFEKEPIHRQYHHNDLTFGLLYAFTENFVLPLSHDEVVHGKRSLLSKMPGDDWQKRANLRALYCWMWAHPGKQLLFMGSEFGQWGEWQAEHTLDWWLLADPAHAGLRDLVRDCNRLQAEHPALYEKDFSPEGFGWLVNHDAPANVVAVVRWASRSDAGPVVCIANLAPVVRLGYELTLPRGGAWREILNSDAVIYGGSGVGNLGRVEADALGKCSVSLPPLGVLWLTPEA